MSAQVVTTSAIPIEQWWEVLGSADLNGLVEEGLKHNPSVDLAVANFKQAEALRRQAVAAFLPSVDGQLQGSRNRNAVNVLSPTLTSGAPVFGLYAGQLSVNYALDLFGANRRAYEAAAANSESAEWQLQATRLVVAGNVASAAINHSLLAQQVALTDKAMQEGQLMLDAVKASRETGQLSDADVALEQVNFASIATQAAQARLRFGVAQDVLAVYLGRLPESVPLSEVVVKDFIPQVPLVLPSQLVNRRPDVKAAEAQLHVATANVGVATASLLPSIALSGNLGSTATLKSDLFKTNTGYWSGGVTLSQSLFEGGALFARKAQAKAQMDAAGAQYRLAVLTAFQNVADSLHAFTADEQIYQQAVLADEATARQLAVATLRFNVGELSPYQYHQSMQAAQLSKAQRFSALANVLNDWVALSTAIAGRLPNPEH
jgi:NodT family efflux transporter outer membrane factor (OMF) lipoprotein